MDYATLHCFRSNQTHSCKSIFLIYIRRKETISRLKEKWMNSIILGFISIFSFLIIPIIPKSLITVMPLFYPSATEQERVRQTERERALVCKCKCNIKKHSIHSHWYWIKHCIPWRTPGNTSNWLWRKW